MRKLENKTAIITGATSGIGLGIVTSFLEEGANVVFCGRRKEKGESIVSDLNQKGFHNVTFVQADVTALDDVENLFKTTQEIYGDLDILVNNAGMLVQFSIEDMDIEKDLDRVLSLNLRSYFINIKYALKSMKNGGAIINIASIGGLGGDPNLSSYGATKAGVINLTKSMARELGPRGIRTNAISPGTIFSEIMERDSEFTKQTISLIPLGRGGEPSEIGSVAAFLASEEASYINGANIVVDGGMIV